MKRRCRSWRRACLCGVEVLDDLGVGVEVVVLDGLVFCDGDAVVVDLPALGLDAVPDLADGVHRGVVDGDPGGLDLTVAVSSWTMTRPPYLEDSRRISCLRRASMASRLSARMLRPKVVDWAFSFAENEGATADVDDGLLPGADPYASARLVEACGSLSFGVPGGQGWRRQGIGEMREE